jgi:hypothetical protein
MYHPNLRCPCHAQQTPTPALEVLRMITLSDKLKAIYHYVA